MKIIHIDTGIQRENSVSRLISAQVMEKLKAAHPDASVIYRDFAAEPVPHLTEASWAAAQGWTTDYGPEIAAELALGETLLEEFMAADVVVIGAAFYNLTVSSALKAWIDRILILNKTFRYTAEGALEGLMGGKRVILGISRGGFYCEGTPGAAMEHCENYLQSIFAFIGVSQIDVIAVDGVTIGADDRDRALADATSKIASLEL